LPVPSVELKKNDIFILAMESSEIRTVKAFDVPCHLEATEVAVLGLAHDLFVWLHISGLIPRVSVIKAVFVLFSKHGRNKRV